MVLGSLCIEGDFRIQAEPRDLPETDSEVEMVEVVASQLSSKTDLRRPSIEINHAEEQADEIAVKDTLCQPQRRNSLLSPCPSNLTAEGIVLSAFETQSMTEFLELTRRPKSPLPDSMIADTIESPKAIESKKLASNPKLHQMSLMSSLGMSHDENSNY